MPENDRLELAKKLRALADRSSEIELRNAVSRSWYSIYHAANVLFGTSNHQEVVTRITAIDGSLGARAERVRIFRSQADYDPTLVRREFGGDLELFRQSVLSSLDDGRLIFSRLLNEMEKKGR